MRPVEHHLALTAARDVIEFPIVGDIDTGGWDLRKALRLALNGNVVVVEWLKSPIAYEEEVGFRSRLGGLLDPIMVLEKSPPIMSGSCGSISRVRERDRSS
ncbi:DNA polymerase beta superfamily protein [Rhizobium phaseoli]|uniref:DNA polymerase beta superfamily protein n=1 Tax=Rhizobium phaseoli TaxID=396 RepID=UPI00202A520F|nr:nucleotidyltransferase domain-containing protein [Rhizobium phaseoli]